MTGVKLKILRYVPCYMILSFEPFKYITYSNLPKLNKNIKYLKKGKVYRIYILLTAVNDSPEEFFFK